MKTRENELSNKSLEVIMKFFEEWAKKNSEKDNLYIVQQLNLVALRIKEISFKLEEDYKRGIGK
jgi:hypothetical protein